MKPQQNIFPAGTFDKVREFHRENEVPELLKQIEHLKSQIRGLKAYHTVLRKEIAAARKNKY